jgi:hypothetical protein
LFIIIRKTDIDGLSIDQKEDLRQVIASIQVPDIHTCLSGVVRRDLLVFFFRLGSLSVDFRRQRMGLARRGLEAIPLQACLFQWGS